MSAEVEKKFVKVNKNLAWFLKTVGGSDTQKGSCRAVDVLDEIRHAVDAKFNVPPDAGTAVAADPMDAVVAAVDPMDAVFALEDAEDVSKPKRARKKKGMVTKNEVVTIEMPLRPRCADAACEEKNGRCVLWRQNQERDVRGN